MPKVDMPAWATHRVIDTNGAIEPAILDNGKYYCEEEMITSYIIEDGAWSVIDEDKEYADEHITLTKREHFAGLAMQNLLNSFNPYEQGDFDSSDFELTAKLSVGLADALLKELSK